MLARSRLSQKVESNPGIYHGHAGFERMVRATDEVWDAFRTDPHDAGDHVVVGVTISGSGSGSGVVAEMSLFNVVTVRAGKIVRVVGGLPDRAEALAVAGRRGERASPS